MKDIAPLTRLAMFTGAALKVGMGHNQASAVVNVQVIDQTVFSTDSGTSSDLAQFSVDADQDGTDDLVFQHGFSYSNMKGRISASNSAAAFEGDDSRLLWNTGTRLRFSSDDLIGPGNTVGTGGTLARWDARRNSTIEGTFISESEDQSGF